MPNLSVFWEALSPAARLATAYVAIVMVLSLIFSLVLYEFSTAQLTDGLREQYTQLYREFGPTALDPYQFQADLNDRKQALVWRLVYFNVVILALASLLSYFLAKRTLQPIEEALEAQSRFAGDASHELRTPLTAMQTEIEVTLRNEKHTTKQEAIELLRSNLEEVAKLRTLADGLLRLARGENDSEMIPVSIAAAVNEAVSRVSKRAEEKHIKIAAEAAPIKVLGDLPNLTELVVILLDNAIKYSSEHGDISITTSVHGRSVSLKIADKGVGISPSDLPHIFDRFYRADKSRSQSGYGLGLSIAEKIAHIHRGSISASSNKGKGSTFTVKLPVA